MLQQIICKNVVEGDGPAGMCRNTSILCGDIEQKVVGIALWIALCSCITTEHLRRADRRRDDGDVGRFGWVAVGQIVTVVLAGGADTCFNGRAAVDGQELALHFTHACQITLRSVTYPTDHTDCAHPGSV